MHRLVLTDDLEEPVFPTSSVKRKKLTVEPSAQRERIKAIDEVLVREVHTLLLCGGVVD